MLILGINTSGENGEIALVSEQGVIIEKFWESNNNESEFLLPSINQLMSDANSKFEDLDKVFVIQGPGPFTALRVSIAVANAIAYAEEIPVISASIFKYFDAKSDVDFAIYAGRNQMWFHGDLMGFDEFYKKLQDENIHEIFGVIPFAQKQILAEKGVNVIHMNDLKSFGNTILDMMSINFDGCEENFIAKPLYFSAPHITKSKKSYK
ncbi:tRNA (adenosine(37)-N6)-threonylcarbamoyltransferase complex dimerization subunit type 1 TsaB [Patescibacteria group bacterium]|nr:tRNA (adenosine(37)-N6)-threonylcarbamoyltransferase complex dimerization subunit type 1 TsaB [Patescibacteria group bacterium]